MFFALSKLLDWLLSPLSWALLLLVWAMLARARPRRSLALTALATAILVVFSSESLAYRLSRLGERGAVSTYRPDVVYDVVVVLGGMVDIRAARASGEIELDEHVDRIVRAWDLLRTGRARNVLLSAGNAEREPAEPAEADLLAALLVRWGVSPDRIAIEARSRNTHENAVESSRIIAARGWRTVLLVTSAVHMPRSLGCFRAVGLEPDTLPVDRRTGDGRGANWLPRAGVLSESTDVLRELAGRLVYRAVGYAR